MISGEEAHLKLMSKVNNTILPQVVENFLEGEIQKSIENFKGYFHLYFEDIESMYSNYEEDYGISQDSFYLLIRRYLRNKGFNVTFTMVGKYKVSF